MSSTNLHRIKFTKTAIHEKLMQNNTAMLWNYVFCFCFQRHCKFQSQNSEHSKSFQKCSHGVNVMFVCYDFLWFVHSKYVLADKCGFSDSHAVSICMLVLVLSKLYISVAQLQEKRKDSTLFIFFNTTKTCCVYTWKL